MGIGVAGAGISAGGAAVGLGAVNVKGGYIIADEARHIWEAPAGRGAPAVHQVAPALSRSASCAISF